MTYGQKVMVIGGVRVTDAAMKRLKFNSDKAKARRQLETLRNHALRDAYEQTDATAHLTDVEELK